MDQGGRELNRELITIEAADSKLVTSGAYYSPSNNDNYLQVRLCVAHAILAGETVVIPEGWALDSLVFIRVLAELQRAIEKIEKSSNAPEQITRFLPVAMQIRFPGDRLDAFVRYLERGNVPWKLPNLRENEDGHAHLLEAIQLRKSRSDKGFTRSSFEDCFRDVLGHE